MNLNDLEKNLSDNITVKKYYDALFQFLNNNINLKYWIKNCMLILIMKNINLIIK